MTLDELARQMLEEMCDAMIGLQVRATGYEHLDGSLLCPACLHLHGRASDAMEPLLQQARISGRQEYADAAQALFCWLERTMSQPDGSWKNDIDSDWKGISVFTCIMLENCLSCYGDLLRPDMRDSIDTRLRRAAGYLYEASGSLVARNINYPLSNALALFLLGKRFGEQRYLDESEALTELAWRVVSPHGLLFGEGIPRDRHSPKGCCSIDLGYNMEETIPALVELAHARQDARLWDLAAHLMERHLSFMLPDGGIDNSWGTRNYKWTWWGSRTTDGIVLSLGLLAQKDARFLEPLKRHLGQLRRTMHSGLLFGGPDYQRAGEEACVHHTFTHAKGLARFVRLSLGRSADLEEKLPEGYGRFVPEGTFHWSECDTFVEVKGNMRATVTAYDWTNMPDGHASGGTLSLLYHHPHGPILAAGMCSYARKEKYNMQVPREIHRHVCATMRLQVGAFSSMYDTKARMIRSSSGIFVQGTLCDAKGERASGCGYSFEYHLAEDAIEIKARLQEGMLILPLVADQIVCKEAHRLVLAYRGGMIEVTSHQELTLPYGREICFNLVPGFLLVPVAVAFSHETMVRIAVGRV